MTTRAAIYARYSTDLQREASIVDQFRVCERLAERHGFQVVARHQDAAISGGTTQRPGYQAMLSAARRGDFEVIVAEDASRLWRSLAEQAPRLAELHDLGVAVVTHDLDTRHESAAIMGAVGGAMAEQYRREIGRRTRRGLEGRAREGKSAGGRAYGYRTDKGTREVDPEQAAVVRRIFTLFAGGKSARAIASVLNAERVPSPGSTWSRKQRRRAGWLASAISGDPTRGIGILNNDLYRGVAIWNRARWIRSAVDGKKRKQVMNARADWIVRHDESLRVVSDPLWQAVKQRQRERTDLIGRRVKRGLSKRAAKSTGRPARYLFSGLLICGACESRLTISGGPPRYYACASHLNGGAAACGNDVRVRRDLVEEALLARMQRDMLAPGAAQEVCRRVRAILRKRPKPSGARRRRLEVEIRNLTDAIAAGMLRASPALGERLRDAESDLARLSVTPEPAAIEHLLPDLEARYQRAVRDLGRTITGVDPDRARLEVSRVLGPVKVKPTATEIRFYNEKGRQEAAILRAIGYDRNCGSGGLLRSARVTILHGARRLI